MNDPVEEARLHYAEKERAVRVTQAALSELKRLNTEQLAEMQEASRAWVRASDEAAQ